MSDPSNISPSRPGQVYVMQEEPVEGGTHNYKGGCACLCGILLIIASGFALGFEILVITLRGGFTGTGIWCGLVFFPTGVVSMVGGCKKSKCTIITTLVMNIISGLSAVCLIIMSCFWAALNLCHGDIYSPAERGGGYECVASHLACVAAGIIALTCDIFLIVNTCKVIFGCCGAHGLGQGQGQVHHDRLRPEPAQPRIVDPTRNPNDTLSQLNALIPMFSKYENGIIHRTAEEN